MLIGELAERANISAATIRRLKGKGVLKTERDRNGWRVFDESAVMTLRGLYKRRIEISSDEPTTSAIRADDQNR
jgi:DNA-binding transcriptional MerR regulator